MGKSEPSKDGKKSRAEYMKKWRASHKEEQKAYRARYWDKRAKEDEKKQNEETQKEIERVLWYWENSDNYGREILFANYPEILTGLVQNKKIKKSDFDNVKKASSKRWG